MVNINKCFNKEKHCEVFKDVKVGDTLYFLLFDGDTDVFSDIKETFGDLASFVVEHDVSNVPSFNIVEHKVKEVIYPGLVPHTVTYMCKYGGLGHSTSMRESEWSIDFILDNDDKIQMSVGQNMGSLGPHEYVFITNDALKDTVQKYYENVINEAEQKYEKYKQIIEECQQNLKLI